MVVSLLLAMIPVTAVFAINDISLSITSGEVGDEITVTASNWYSSTTERWANVLFSNEDASVTGQYTALDSYKNIGGGFIGTSDSSTPGYFTSTVTVDVPSVLNDGSITRDVTAGTYYIYITITTSAGSSSTPATTDYIWSKATFTVTGGELSLSSYNGQVDSSVVITGTGFPNSTAVSIAFDSTTISSGSTATSTTGTFSSTITVPEATAGIHNIVATVGSVVRSETFTVTPKITMNPNTGEAGITARIIGKGFSSLEPLSVSFNGQPVSFAIPPNIDSKGTFNELFQIPSTGLSPNVYQVIASDGTNQAAATFTLNASTPTETTTTTATTVTTTTPVNNAVINVNVQGSYMSIGGSGYTPNSVVTVLLDGTQIDTVNSNATGQVTVSPFELAKLSGGNHEIIVTDGTNSASYTFTIESTPPGIPTPKGPKQGAKIKSTATFEWNPITDATLPVTYELQIATSQTFATGTVVLDIKNIETPLYKLTELQAANLVEQAEPYYYRVRAIDGASNEGSWAAPVGFYVTESAGFPTWAWYTIIGIGGVLLFGIGYLVGRRTAFYY